MFFFNLLIFVSFVFEFCCLVSYDDMSMQHNDFVSDEVIINTSIKFDSARVGLDVLLLV